MASATDTMILALARLRAVRGNVPANRRRHCLAAEPRIDLRLPGGM